MARTIPSYQRQVIESGVQSAPTASGNISANDPIANGLANLGQAGSNLAGVLRQEQEQKAKDRAAIDVANVLSQGEVYWQEDFNKRAQAWTPGAADMRDGIGQDFDKWVSDSAAKLPTEQARNYFQQHAVAMKTRMQTGAYSFQEKATAEKLTVDTDIGIEADKKVVFSDPTQLDNVLRRRGETILARSDLSPAQKTKQVNDLKGKYSLASETGDMLRNPGEWLKKNYGVNPAEAPAAGGAPGSVSATAAGPVADRLWKAQISQESGGKQFGKDGKPLTSTAGAIGVAQVMPGTAPEAAKLAGLPWDERRYQQDAGYNEALGKAYMAKQLQTFGGDVPKALAAYNMGPGSAARGNGVAGLVAKHGENWLQHAPAETRDYVAKITKNAGINGAATAAAPASMRVASAGAGTVSDAGSGMGEIPATRSPAFGNLDIEQQLQLKGMAEARFKQDETKVLANVSIDAATQAVARQNIGSDAPVNLEEAKATAVALAQQKTGRVFDPAQTLQVEGAVERAAGVRERDRKRNQDAAAGSMFDLLDKNGGDYQDLQRQKVGEMADLPRATVDRLQDYAGKVATGQTRATDWQAYSQLIESPQTLAQVNLASLRDKFSSTEFNQLLKLQETTKKAIEAGKGDQTIQGDMAVVKSLMADAGLTNDKKEAQFFSVLQREMDVRREATGKKHLTQAEVKEIAADLLVKEVTRKGVLWDTKEAAYSIEVPAPERAKIAAALNAAGLPVNDSNILRAYRNKLSKGQK